MNNIDSISFYLRQIKLSSMKGISVIIVSSLLLISCSESKEKGKDNSDEKENKLTICDCAHMPQDKAPDECFKLKEEWEKQFEMADVTQKEEMTKEMIDCMNKK